MGGKVGVFAMGPTQRALPLQNGPAGSAKTVIATGEGTTPEETPLGGAAIATR